MFSPLKTEAGIPLLTGPTSGKWRPSYPLFRLGVNVQRFAVECGPIRVARTKSGLEPPRPHPIHAGVRDRRCGHASAFAPGAAVENSCDGGEQDVAPVEVDAACAEAFIEMRQAEEH